MNSLDSNLPLTKFLKNNPINRVIPAMSSRNLSISFARVDFIAENYSGALFKIKVRNIMDSLKIIHGSSSFLPLKTERLQHVKSTVNEGSPRQTEHQKGNTPPEWEWELTYRGCDPFYRYGIVY